MAKTRKKLLVLTSTFPRHPNDPVPARFVLDLSRRLAEAYRVVVVAPHDPGAAYEEYFGSIKVCRFPYFFPTRLQRLCNGVGILPNLRRGILPKLQVPFLFLTEYLFIKKVLRTEKPDLIHSHWAIPQGFCAALALPPTMPHYLTVHSSDLHTLRRIPLGRTLMHYVLKRVRVTVLVSEYLRSMLKDMCSSTTALTRVLPMGVDEGFYRMPKKKRRKPLYQLLFIGKLIEVKGVAYLIEAMSRAVTTIPQLRLMITGDGPLKARLTKKAAELGLLNRHITFCGQIPHHVLPEQMRQADALVVPSIITQKKETEGMPVVILESLAAGLPVLASDVGGLKEVVIDRLNGLIFPHSKAEQLAAAIARFYHPSIFSRLCYGAKDSA